MPTWNSEINISSQLGDFKSDIGKDIASLGSWEQDFNHICKKHGIIPSPFVSLSIDEASGKCSCCIMNCEVDLGSWRAALLAANCTGTSVHEYKFINLKLTPQHVFDFVTALEKSSLCEIVKFDYIVMDGDASSMVSAWKALIAAVGNGVTYLSLKGNNIDDDLISNFKSELQNSLSLRFVNFAENRIADAGLSCITQSWLLHPTLQSISLRNNHLTASSLSESLRGLIFGKVPSPEEEAEMKTMVKAVNDRNKQIKDTNKKRKKQGLTELEDIPSPSTRLVKIESGETLLVNRSSVMIDISRNALASAGLAAFLRTLVTEASTISPIIAQSQPLTLKCSGILDEETRAITFADAQQAIIIVE